MLRFVRRTVRRVALLGVLGAGSVVGFNYAEDKFWESRPDNGYTPSALPKPKLVVLGSGWASVSLLQSIDTNKYDVFCVSPRNYFLFTPLLPSTTVGTLENRSIVIPMREIVSPKRHPIAHRIAAMIYGRRSLATFIEASCKHIDPVSKQIFCERANINSSLPPLQLTLDYDHLVVAVGSTSNTFGVPGVREHCFFLKSVEDSRAIRGRMISCLEAAALCSSPEEKKRNLNFVVVGGGPTGVEFAAEAQDFLREDAPRLYPNEAPHANVTLIQSADHILSTYDLKISEFTETLFANSNIHLLTNSAVTAVHPSELMLKDRNTKAESSLAFAMCVWSTGVQPLPLVAELIKRIPGQSNSRAIATDSHLRVLGADGIFALGDCSTVRMQKLAQHAEEMFKQADKHGNHELSRDDLFDLLVTISRDHPEAFVFMRKAIKQMKKFDMDNTDTLSLQEFSQLIKSVDDKLKSFPATAQVAAQQGTYLARMLNGHTNHPFIYRHKGELAYTGHGDAACSLGGDVDEGGVVLTGVAAGYLWHAAYLEMLWVFGLKSTLQVSLDWTKKAVFGRDSSRV